jgi:o-succinylbenzoate---CoA ligase
MTTFAQGREPSGRASTAARALQALGARPGRPVVALTRSSEILALLAFAAAAIPAPFFPLDPSLPRAIRRRLLEQSGDALVLGDDGGVAIEAVLSGAPDAPLAFAPPAGPALLIATGGSSGEPKAVVLTGDNLRASAAASAAITPLGPGDRWLASVPLFHIGGFSILARCAFAGADLVLGEGYDAESLLSRLIAERVTHVSLTPTMLAQLAALGSPPQSLRHALVGGASLPARLARGAAGLGWPVQPTYGMTETGSQLATLSSLPAGWRSGRMGRPLPGVEIALTPDGRVKARGAVVMHGYANPGLAPGDGLHEGWFVTSDLAEISASGELTVLGRADDVIVTGGKKVLPSAVEDLLAACPGIGRFAVMGQPDPLWGEAVAVVYDGTIRPDELLSFCRRHVEGAFRPRSAQRLESFPLLANGKIDRLALRKRAFGDEAEAGAGGQQDFAADDL